VLLGVLLTACGLIDDAVTDRAVSLEPYECGTAVLAVGAHHPVVGCEDGAAQLIDGRWVIASQGQVTAILDPPPDGDGRTRFLTRSGKFGVLEQGRPHEFINLPVLRTPQTGAAYSWRPPGLEDVGDEVYTGLYRTGSQDLYAITAGAGATVSEDEGATWQIDAAWNPRFQALDGTRPLDIEDLILSETGRIAFLLHPEGRHLSAKILARLVEEGVEDTTSDGPKVATGVLSTPGIKVRAVPTGLSHHLVLSADASTRGLWLFVTHPHRAETTRFHSHDWGRFWIDTGYYDFATIHAVGSRRRVALIGVDNRERTMVKVLGADRFSRVAILGPLPPGTGDLVASLDDVTSPTRLLIARGPAAQLHDLSHVGIDLRLAWYYLPATILLLLTLAFMGRRFLTDLRKRRAARADNG
jgi:hypothetical protein